MVTQKVNNGMGGPNYGLSAGLSGDVDVIQPNDDGSLLVMPMTWAGYNNLADDAPNIQYAMGQAQMYGAPVHLALANYNIYTPIQHPLVPGVTNQVGVPLIGALPVNCDAGGDVLDIYGTVLNVQPTFNLSGLTNPGCINFNPFSNSGKIRRPMVKDLWINTTNAPNGVIGISSQGNVFHGSVYNVGIWGNSSDGTNDGFRFDKDSFGNDGDGWELKSMIVQNYGRLGGYVDLRDTVMDNVHFQGAAASTTDNGCLMVAKGENMRFDRCRFDQSTWGVITDSNPGGTINTAGSEMTFTDCGSENIYHSAFWANNSSTTGQQMRTPIRLNGFSFDFPGRDGSSACVLVSGLNNLIMNECSACIGIKGSQGPTFYPQLLLQAQAVGSAAQGPMSVIIDGGLYNIYGNNWFSGQTNIAQFRYRFYGLLGGPIQGGATPSVLTSVISTPWP